MHNGSAQQRFEFSFFNGALAVASAAIVLLQGCATSAKKPPPDWLAQNWTETMATYHIQAVYPPTEDVHVGDVYAFPDCGGVTSQHGVEISPYGCQNEGLAPFNKAVKIGHAADTIAHLEEYYKSQPYFAHLGQIDPNAVEQTAPSNAATAATASAACKKTSPELPPSSPKDDTGATEEPKSSGKKNSSGTGAAKSAVGLRKAVANPNDAPETTRSTVNKSKQLSLSLSSQSKAKQVGQAQPAVKAADNASGKQPESVFKRLDVVTDLPIAEFPDFDISNSDSAGASIKGPIGIFASAFGFSSDKKTSLRVQIQDVHTYGLTADRGFQEIMKYCWHDNCQRSSIERILDGALGYHGERLPMVMVVSRVYLAGRIVYTFVDDSAYGLQGQFVEKLTDAVSSQVAKSAAASADKTTSNAQSSTAMSSTNDKPAKSAESAPGDPCAGLAAGEAGVQTIEAALQALSNRLNAGTAGAAFEVLSVSHNGITIQQTFARPVAVGYLGISIPAQYLPPRSEDSTGN